ncbi:hypothetical protein GLAREA_07925 [Glarea lozoyensis ATCC 20868]|uniref:Uncharacterized protein n=1 Tax=Glarea lozoyensis (strain ATCC 20868 / MF5171) TaxID=1116229 RepID=S3DLA1_GLAL2|nr:uncharacterized protein GLAREA_07925 [Glarea lozoyensis ATCC 20868]EPE32791.1 hypothetical protein GLAREA_07925 [Glarea lozoyensis ATCC 20868]
MYRGETGADGGIRSFWARLERRCFWTVEWRVERGEGRGEGSEGDRRAMGLAAAGECAGRCRSAGGLGLDP